MTTSTPIHRVIIRNLSEKDTEQDEMSGADSDSSDIRIDPSNLIHPAEFHRFLDSCHLLLLEYIESEEEEEDDDGLSHLRECNLNTPDWIPHW